MKTAEDSYYYWSDLTIPHIKKISTEIQKILDEDNYIASVQNFLRIHEHKDIIPWIKEELLQAFAIAFEEVTSKPENGWLRYNTSFQTEIRLNIILWMQDYQSRAESGDRQHFYVNDFVDWQKWNAIAKKVKKLKEQKKIWLAHDHKLCTPQSFEFLEPKYFITLNVTINNYCQKFLIDKKDKEALAYFINRYFIFIFINTLLQSKLVFEFRSKRWNNFFREVWQKTVQYLKDNISDAIHIDMKMFQQKFFYNGKNDLIWPIELSYQNAELDDIQTREKYLATNYFGTEDETAKSVRRKVMAEYGKWLNAIDKTFEIRNPWYYRYQDQIEGAKNWIAKLEPGEKQEALILLPAIFQDIDKYRQEQKKYETKIERERESSKKDPSPTITEIQQQYLRYYKVPIQFRQLFGIIIHRYNHYYGLKTNILKKRDGYFEFIKDLAWDPELSSEAIIHYINEFITDTEVKKIFKDKWEKKQHNKRENLLAKIEKKREMYVKKMIRKDEIKNIKCDKNQGFLDLPY